MANIQQKAEEDFTNGDNIHFTYNEQHEQDANSNPATSSKNKKKKKKKKNKGTTAALQDGSVNDQRVPQLQHAMINNPDEDYPESRVIKQGPNGDVIVESLDHQHQHNEGHSHSNNNDDFNQHQGHSHSHGHNLVPNQSEIQNNQHQDSYGYGIPHPNPANIWDNSTLEEQEDLKKFWESLDEPEKMKLVKIDKDSIMEIFKNETRNAVANGHSNGFSGASNGSSSNIVNSKNQGGSNSNAAHHHHAHNHHGQSHNHPHNGSHANCQYCGRKSNIIEDELENIYDNHFDDIIDFIHEVRDINDLNALPGLLFGGFHMLEEEHKLQKLKERERRKTERTQKVIEEEEDDEDIEEIEEDEEEEDEEEEGEEPKEQQLEEKNVEKKEEKAQEENIALEQPEALLARQIEDLHVNGKLDSGTLKTDQQANNAPFVDRYDPKLFQALEDIDFDKIRDDMLSNISNTNGNDFLEKVGSLREIINQLHKSDKDELEKGMSFLQSMGTLFNNPEKQQSLQEQPQSESEQRVTHASQNEAQSADLTKGLSSFADDLLKNDGLNFIEMMETLSECRNKRDDLLSYRDEIWVDEDEDDQREDALQEIHDDEELQGNGEEVYGEEEDGEEYEEYGEEEGEDNDEHEHEHDHHHDCGHHHDHDHDHQHSHDHHNDHGEEEYEDEDEEGSLDVSDTESEISEEEKMQEIRRLFLIQVIKLFQERLKSAYKEKLSQDRTQKLIEELEAEENAKKEREMKKLKQKEKAKEKKRLQQLAKEEEKRKKEEEDRAKEDEIKRKQEFLKEEQRKKKEEARIKREEEKKKRIDELKRKEAEQQKRIELQRKKEEEARKVKEERKKKAEDLKKKKDEEKKQRDLLKKQKEEEREQMRKEQEQRDEELEAESLLKEQSAVVENGILRDEPSKLLDHPTIPTSNSTNHLLEQLYHAKPRSSSSSFANGSVLHNNLTSPTPHHLPTAVGGWNTDEIKIATPVMNSHIPISQKQQSQQQQNVPSQFSQHTQQGQAHHHLHQQPVVPTSNILLGNSFLHSSIPTMENSINSPGNPLFTDSYSVSMQQLNNWNGTNVTVDQKATTPVPTPSRNSSIWGSTSGSLWQNQSPQQPLQQPPLQQTPLQQTPLQQQSSVPDVDIIQSRAYQAFQILQQTQQLEFGVAPSIKLFQTTKNILGNSELTLNQFLLACSNSNGINRFDFIYDDFGTVRHIKVTGPGQAASNGMNSSNHNLSQQGSHVSPVSGHNNIIGNYGEINPFANSGNRGLWN
ncbi:stress response protein Nst1p [[Candida] railenensis]|uniref:Stress response protein NST1 n=1 Tax=[Candida] railenensis TaxID=45579 RepID=A0A9P0QVJ7_9ASCO|nr:stress response protein Nst1p [[Candida] railenensis]